MLSCYGACNVRARLCVQESSLLMQQASLKGELEGNQQQVENFKVTKPFSSLRFLEFDNNLSNIINIMYLERYIKECIKSRRNCVRLLVQSRLKCAS